MTCTIAGNSFSQSQATVAYIARGEIRFEITDLSRQVVEHELLTSEGMYDWLDSSKSVTRYKLSDKTSAFAAMPQGGDCRSWTYNASAFELPIGLPVTQQ